MAYPFVMYTRARMMTKTWILHVSQKYHKTQVEHLLAKQSQKYAFGLYFFATKASRERVPPGSPGVFWKNTKKQRGVPPEPLEALARSTKMAL